MIYAPTAFRMTDREPMHDLIDACGLAMLATAGMSGPLVSHVPMMLDRAAAPLGTLTGHLARGNPQWKSSDLSQPALAVFMGPDAYVSPRSYATKKEDPRVVPTWNYVMVQARGRIEFFEDAARLREIVTALTDRHEAGAAEPWRVADAPEDYLARSLRAIVGFRLVIEEIHGKRKLSQNRPETDRDSVAATLSASARQADRDVACLMRAGNR